MKSLILLSFFVSASYADIGLKLRQQQENRGYNYDSRSNPFYIPKPDNGNIGGAVAAATNVERRASGNTQTERSHTLEELCNDSFHSFLCKPVSGQRRRIDGNLRPGAVLPPGLLRPESSNTRENKLLPLQPSSSNASPNKVRPYDSHIASAQSDQGYLYPKPSNTYEVNKPLRNGYLPPDNKFNYSPPPIQTTRPQPTRPPFIFSTTTQRPLVTKPSTIKPFIQNTFRTTPRPLISTFPTTTKPTTFYTPQPTFSQQKIYNTYLPPVTASTTRQPPTSRVPFFTSPSSIQPTVYTSRFPPQTRPQPPPVTKPSIRFTTSTPKPVTLQQFPFPTLKVQTLANTYLPPFSEQRISSVYIPTTTTTPRPTTQATTYTTSSTFNVPQNSYLPPENPAIDVRFGSASNNPALRALLPSAAQNPSITVKPDEEFHDLETLCNDAFHSFLCQPLTKPRYRFDGNIRPQAIIPPGVLMTANSINKPVKALPELQSGTSLDSVFLPKYENQNGNNYEARESSSQPPVNYLFPSQNELTGTENLASTGYYYPTPSGNGVGLTSLPSTSQSQYNFLKSTSITPIQIFPETISDITSITQYTTDSTTPKPLIQNTQYLQNINKNDAFFIPPLEKSSSEKGYDYPKPYSDQILTFPSTTARPITYSYKTPTTESPYYYTSSTTSTPIETTTFSYQPTRPQSFFTGTGYDNISPSRTPDITITTREKPVTLLYDYQDQIPNQVSSSFTPQTFITLQQPQLTLSTASTQKSESNGYNYPRPEQPFDEQPTINTAQGYFYPKPSISFPDNSLTSNANPQYFKNRKIEFNSISKDHSYPSNKSNPPAQTYEISQQSGREVDPKLATNINQLLGPPSDSVNSDLPPSSQFEVLKVRKRQNG